MSNPFPPYEPGGQPANGKGSTRKRIPLRIVLPNVVTLLALCSGLTAIRMAMEDRWDMAIAAIFLAAILDALDGRVARMLKGTTKFGAELDSLADFVNFGVAPGIILYAWMLEDASSLGWIASLLFSICMALRLARFNVALDDPNKPKWANKFFTGVPAPAGALTVLLPIYLERLGVPHWNELALPVALYTMFIGLLMVSQLPTFSGKQIGTHIRREWVLPLFVVAVGIVALAASYPFECLTVISLGYLISIPFAWRSYKIHCVTGKGPHADCDVMTTEIEEESVSEDKASLKVSLEDIAKAGVPDPKQDQEDSKT
ncbi:CDP-diacylglycerol--serine O-phosphatidyltransferase [Pseudovibrio sp. FO-BEG1]|uniref:CDP-diacylglycerol--serine O-phosphatidyltransferase n=2 Tax=Pseudovibrio denitrificans TaxID=258256 RepID=A0A1I6Y1T6_9HYPH|nr:MULTISPECIES: CDP-diacylglycerol--serine O-phosphatidyltransferase [Pseudovibrio]AEV37178.1 CDP-diacylglycerol--serine O-phosphatidyltransferase [Pseudovibrio sp. FO-BEG1]SFT44585.1 CDP-diacylglycerol---serine O-phosphatidyltransferase [Pseudovibrio denitrificans]